jgi:hypothetical protein
MRLQYFISLSSLLWKNKGRLMRSPCCLCVFVTPPPQFLKAGTVEPEETVVTILYKHVCDMTPESRNSAVREAPRRRPLLGNSLVIRPSDWVLNFCWPSPKQWFFVPSPTELMTIFYWLTPLDTFRLPTLGLSSAFTSGRTARKTLSPTVNLLLAYIPCYVCRCTPDASFSMWPVWYKRKVSG